MNIDELVKEQRAKEETYDNERTDVRNRIAHLEQRLKDIEVSPLERYAVPDYERGEQNNRT